jgi:hypothetical protein
MYSFWYDELFGVNTLVIVAYVVCCIATQFYGIFVKFSSFWSDAIYYLIPLNFPRCFRRQTELFLS